MRVVWELQDVKSGRRVQRPGVQEIWQIGYLPGVVKEGMRYCLVSLNDGLIGEPCDVTSLCRLLNDGDYWPAEWVPE